MTADSFLDSNKPAIEAILAEHNIKPNTRDVSQPEYDSLLTEYAKALFGIIKNRPILPPVPPSREAGSGSARQPPQPPTDSKPLSVDAFLQLSYEAKLNMIVPHVVDAQIRVTEEYYADIENTPKYGSSARSSIFPDTGIYGITRQLGLLKSEVETRGAISLVGKVTADGAYIVEGYGWLNGNRNPENSTYFALRFDDPILHSYLLDGFFDSLSSISKHHGESLAILMAPGSV